VDAEERELVREITESEKITLLLLHLMELFLQVLILKTSIMLSLLHQVNQELEIYNQLEECLEKEKIKLKQSL
jgi:hypothetical protein